VPVFVDINVSEADINAIAYGFSVFAGVCNVYLTNATSDKVGLPARSENH